MSNSIPNLTFEGWKIEFLAYMAREKSFSNPGLIELIYLLDELGCEEIYVCIFNFLRRGPWKEFCRERQSAKREAQILLTRAKKYLGLARAAHQSLLIESPEFFRDRVLSEGLTSNFADILEQEATFLEKQAGIVTIVCRTKKAQHSRLDLEQLKSKRALRDELVDVAERLIAAAGHYRNIDGINRSVRLTKSFRDLLATDLPKNIDVIIGDIEDLHARAPFVFNKKRAGINHNLMILVGLQRFIEEFGKRWGAFLSPQAVRKLSESDLADLLEAGKCAMGLPDEQTLTDPDSVGRALSRFKARYPHPYAWQSLNVRAQQICDQLNDAMCARQI